MTLIIEKFEYKALQKNKDRKYIGEGIDIPLPSVTTILDKTKSAEKIKVLNEWKARVGHHQAQKITTEAASNGTRMHSYLESYLKTGEKHVPGSNPYATKANIMANTIIEKGLSNVSEVWGSEVNLFYPGLYAGTTDGVGTHLGESAILDYKQTNKPKKEEWIEDYYLQLAAYALAHNKLFETNIRKGVVLMAVAPPELKPGLWGESQYQEFILTPETFDYWANKWWDRVEKYYTLYV